MQQRQEQRHQEQRVALEVEEIVNCMIDAILAQAHAAEFDAGAESSKEEKKDQAAQLDLDAVAEIPSKEPVLSSGVVLPSQPNSTPVIRSEAAAPEIGNNNVVIILWQRRG
jgi:hypothetical protein